MSFHTWIWSYKVYSWLCATVRRAAHSCRQHSKSAHSMLVRSCILPPGLPVSLSHRRLFPPGSWVQTRPILMPIGSILLVDPTKFWKGLATPICGYGDACILDANTMFHIGVLLHHDGKSSPPATIPNLKYIQMRARPGLCLTPDPLGSLQRSPRP